MRKVEKKDFLSTEVVETFKTMVDAGFTPLYFREMRSNENLLLRMRFLISLMGEVSYGFYHEQRIFEHAVALLVEDRGSVAISLVQPYCRVGLYTALPENYTVGVNVLPGFRGRLHEHVICTSYTEMDSPEALQTHLEHQRGELNLEVTRERPIENQPRSITWFTVRSRPATHRDK